tara:strand:+ start:2086 stop:2703 length:618 start_codon:yes stop_codon:yes gene_type:complete
MPKINTYPTVTTPLLTDKLIGTDVGGTIPNQTKNFTVEQLAQIVLTSNASSGVQHKIVQVTPSEMANIATTRKELIANQGTEKIINLVNASWWKEADAVTGNPGYAFAGGLVTTINAVFSGQPFDNTALAQFSIEPTNLQNAGQIGSRTLISVTAANQIFAVNESLVLQRGLVGGDSPTLGGNVFIYISYIIHNTSDFSIVTTTT